MGGGQGGSWELSSLSGEAGGSAGGWASEGAAESPRELSFPAIRIHPAPLQAASYQGGLGIWASGPRCPWPLPFRLQHPPGLTVSLWASFSSGCL